MSDQDKLVRTQMGKVVSSKMNKTIKVQVDRLVAHPAYGKYIRRSSTFLAHDENNESREGDIVVVSVCRPISKRKVWKLDRVVEQVE
jgi:small subunit ribosomal protein S17